MKNYILSAYFTCFTLILFGQPAVQQSVMLENDTVSAPGLFTLRWNADPGATQYRIFRKTPQASSWGGGPIATLDPGILAWTDSTVARNERYEYRVQKLASGYTGYGYMVSGLDVSAVEFPGRVLVIVERDLSAQISSELQEMISDLEKEGWIPSMIEVNRADSPPQVKEQISLWYQSDPGDAKGVILLGHVPVPYSGLIFPDGHTDHQGAWPADGYYADMDGAWSDWQVNNTAGNQSRHHNVPSDGKFDPSSFPTELEIWVGRIDMSGLPAFSESETELTRQYLHKLHAFKTAEFRAEPRGVIEDNFSGFQEGFSQNGWKNFAPIVGKDSVFARDYTGSLKTGSYLFSYGCGPGSYTSSGGISNTATMANDSLQTVFTMLFGSYFGDWDINNSFLRSALASGTILTNFWAGRPHWQIHPMAMGATMGDCARMSMNNIGTYVTGFGARGVHMALLGDPTLQWYYVKPPSDLQVTENGHRIQLAWTGSEDEVLGYYVYRKKVSEIEYSRVSEDMLKNPSFTDSCLVAGESYDYLVRAVAPVHSASGSYYRLSLGTKATFSPVNNYNLTLDFLVDQLYESIQVTNLSQNASLQSWSFGDGGRSEEVSPSYVYARADSVFDVEVCLTARNICFQQMKCDTVTILGSLPRLEEIRVTGPKCHLDTTIDWSAVLDYPGAEPLTFSSGVQRNSNELKAQIPNGTGVVVVTNDLGYQLSYGPYMEMTPDPISGSYEVRDPDEDLLNNGKITIETISGGLPPYEILWSTGSTANEISDLSAGFYWVDITDKNACTHRDSFELKLNTSTYSLQIEGVRIFPNPSYGHIMYEDKLDRPAYIQLADLTGRICAQWSTDGKGVRELYVPQVVAPGLYQLLVEADGQWGTFPLILLSE